MLLPAQFFKSFFYQQWHSLTFFQQLFANKFNHHIETCIIFFIIYNYFIIEYCRFILFEKYGIKVKISLCLTVLNQNQTQNIVCFNFISVLQKVVFIWKYFHQESYIHKTKLVKLKYLLKIRVLYKIQT